MAEDRAASTLADRHDQLRADFLAQTARIAFVELQRYFAAGKLVLVDDSLDLIDVAVALARDNRSRFEDWLRAGAISGVSDSQAQQWLAQETQLWAVVADPWVLVQQGSGDTPAIRD
jgi:hypothetical protein